MVRVERVVADQVAPQHDAIHELEPAGVGLEPGFERAERLMPDNPTPLGCQGDVAHLIGDAAKAGELYQAALAIDPDDELARKNWQRWLTIENKLGEQDVDLNT